jgi:FkbM family methyltransferase
MRLVGISVVKNESDIIESFVRFNLSFLDELWVADNESTDSTQHILHRLSDEFSMLNLRHIEYFDHRQELTVCALLREACATSKFDFAFLLDADEFIKCEGRAALELALGEVRPGHSGALEWVTYLPTQNDDWLESDVLRRIRHRRAFEPKSWQKTVIPFAIGNSPYVHISPGSHHVLVNNEPIPQQVLFGAALAHFPIRSPEQMASKVLLGEWALSLKSWRAPTEGYHWRELADTIATNGLLSREQLVKVAANYASTNEVPVVENPLVSDSEAALRYPELIDLDVIKRIAKFGNRYFSTVSHTPFSNGYMSIGRTRFGPLAYLSADTVIGRSVALYGEWAFHEIELLLSLLRPGDTALDIGANIGTHTIPFAGRVGNSGFVYAFEPQRVVYQMLCANAALNGLANVYAFQAGVSDHDGIVRIDNAQLMKGGNVGNFSINETNTGEEVHLLQLDSLNLPCVRLIKVDVEGMELNVLRGAQQLISRDRPYLFVENNIPDRSEAVLRELESLYYTAYWHFDDYYNSANFYGNQTNFLAAVGRPEINLLCIPTESSSVPPGLQPVTDVTEDWRMGYNKWIKSQERK